MPRSLTIEIMLDEGPALSNPDKERMRWKLGDIVAVYPRKPNVRPGMPRTVYIHIDDIPDRIRIRRVVWTLLHDRGTIVDTKGDLIFRERCRWRISNARVPVGFWQELHTKRSIIVPWAQFVKRIAHRQTDTVFREADLSTGPTA